ncbi:hypothetical protein CTA1_2050 [Colletotrichum tanaceti]|uniref:Methyltransferase domain-containing protein n=1 Tax=Colletotrichum tanaceti TaxID=1306861 RepID=A0A4U6X6J2_9PEZI|nr:hypothetical protein CTA1_2050 [Colletotrichum tanaceti]
MGHMAMTHNRRILQMFCLASAVVFIFGTLHFRTEQANVHSVSEFASSKASNLVNMHGSQKTMVRSMVRSESVWAKTVNRRHEIIAADWGDVSEMPLYSAVDRVSFDAHPYNIWDFMPASYNCPWDVERIGRMGDGGKWVCGMSRYEDYPKDRECVIYSFGVCDESSFEQEMLSRTKCAVWAYDFSVVDFGKQVDSKHRDRAYFKQVGVTGTTNTTQNPPYYSIADLMEMNGHDYV